MSIKLANLFGVEQEADATSTAARATLYCETGKPAQATPFLDGGIVATTDQFMTAFGSTVPRWVLYNWSGYTVRVTALKIQLYRFGNIPATVPRLQLARIVNTGHLTWVTTPTTVGFMPKRTQTGLARDTWASYTNDAANFNFIGGTRVPGDLWEGVIPAVEGLSTLSFFSLQYDPLGSSDTPFELAHREALAMYSVGSVSTASRLILQAEVSSFRAKAG
jgi:hypothetical protein